MNRSLVHCRLSYSVQPGNKDLLVVYPSDSCIVLALLRETLEVNDWRPDTPTRRRVHSVIRKLPLQDLRAQIPVFQAEGLLQEARKALE